MSQSSLSPKAETGKGKLTSGDKSQKRRLVQLQVGEKVFSTTHHTLCEESAYFRSLLSHHDKLLKNEICFVDADPELFSYVLRYLRHGIYPIAFDRSSGHDYATYVGIERLATEFGIKKLAKWLVDKKYESAIKCAVSFERMKPSLVSWLDDTLPSRFHLSADHVNFLPDSNGVIWEVRKRFTARPEAILAVPRESRLTRGREQFWWAWEDAGLPTG